MLLFFAAFKGIIERWQIKQNYGEIVPENLCAYKY